MLAHMANTRRPEVIALLELTGKSVARALPASSRQPKVSAILMAAMLKCSLHGTANCQPRQRAAGPKSQTQGPRLRHVTQQEYSSRTSLLSNVQLSTGGFCNEGGLRLKQMDALSWRESGPPRMTQKNMLSKGASTVPSH